MSPGGRLIKLCTLWAALNVLFRIKARTVKGLPEGSAMVLGALTAVGGGTYTTDLLGQTGAGQLPVGSGFGMLCLGLVFIAIPIVIAILMLRKPKAVTPAVDVVPPTS